MVNWSLQVDEEHQGQRLDNFLIHKLKIPKDLLHRWFRTGIIKVNGKKVAGKYRVMVGDRIEGWKGELEVSKVMPNGKQGEFLLKHIVYEDKRLMVLNKPTGLPCHGGSGVSFGVIELLRQHCSHSDSLELVHRLDRETSGLLMIAKKHSALRELHRLLVAGKVSKKYLAVVKGHLPISPLQISLPLLKNQLRSGERVVKVSPEGKEALTIFRSLEEGEHTSLVEVEPKSGRTHQIRVHGQSAGFPIWGDEKYGDKVFNWGAKRLYLHAYRLKFRWENGELFDLKLPAEDFKIF